MFRHRKQQGEIMKMFNKGLTMDITTNDLKVVDNMLLMFHRAIEKATNPIFKELWSKKYEEAKAYKNKNTH